MASRIDGIDSRQSPIQGLNERRREAVRLRLCAASLASIRKRTGLSICTIFAAHQAFQAGGWEAVPVRPRRLRTGERLLSAQHEDVRVSLMVKHAPDELGLSTLVVADSGHSGLGPAGTPTRTAHARQVELPPALAADGAEAGDAPRIGCCIYKAFNYWLFRSTHPIP